MSCSDVTKNKIIPLFDKRASKSKMVFNNPNERKVERHRVDGCLITTGSRCDYLIRDHNGVEYYVELKGTDIEHACVQLEASIIALTKNKAIQKFAFIVPKACRPAATSKTQLKQKIFKKVYFCTLIIKSL